MVQNILITGAAGYIGGSVLAHLLDGSTKLPTLAQENITVAVRSDEQVKALSALGINVVQLDLNDKDAALESVLKNNINIVVHTASGLNPDLALPWITALGKRREISGEQTYFIHTSGLSAFFQKLDWPDKEMKDTDAIFEVEKHLAETTSFPIRKTDIAVIEHAKAQSVISYIVTPSAVYGKGRGNWNQLSIVLPPVVRLAIASRSLHKFSKDAKTSGVHITDLCALYALVIEKILQKQDIPSGTEGYYLAIGHELPWWETLDRLGVVLHSRGLIDSPEVGIWPSSEAASDSLGVPVDFMDVLWTSGERIVIERPQSIGWKPKWDKERFLREINEEIVAVEQLGEAKSSLVSSLRKPKQ